jgi:predicted PurR-regulated permease PerM
VTDLVIRLGFLGVFAYWSFTLVSPFLSVVVWSVIFTVALYPAYTWLKGHLADRGGLAALLITLLSVAIVVGPVAVLASSLAESIHELASGLRDETIKLPPPWEGVSDWPVVGEPVEKAWRLASTNLETAVKEYGPALLPAGGTVLRKLAAIGGDILILLVSVIIAGFLFVPGPRLALGARRFASRLVQPRGAHFVDLAGATIRNVSRGVIGVAALQALLAGIVLMAADVPGAGLLAFCCLILGIVQIGAAPVLLPVIVWAWVARPGGAALVLTLLLAPVMVVDNVLRPLLMGRGLATPMLVILTGVIGGTISYGLIGLFLGPIVLAVFYELVLAWVQLEPFDGDEAS